MNSISIAYTEHDARALAGVLCQRYDLWSPPKVLDRPEVEAESLHTYKHTSQLILLAEDLPLVAAWIKPVRVYDLMAGSNQLSDIYTLQTCRYQLEEGEPFYLMWDTIETEDKLVRSGRIVTSYHFNPDKATPRNLALWTHVQDTIIHHSPYLTGKPNHGYVGVEMAARVLSGEYALCYDMIPNPAYKA